MSLHRGLSRAAVAVTAGVGVVLTCGAAPALAADERSGVVQTFDFTFPSCLGVTQVDNPFHVTTVSRPGLPSVVNTSLTGGVVLSVFHDVGTYVALPSRAGARLRAGDYDDRYGAVATGDVTYDATGAIATAHRLRELRVITLWDHGTPFFRETWVIDVTDYDENTTQPHVVDECLR